MIYYKQLLDKETILKFKQKMDKKEEAEELFEGVSRIDKKKSFRAVWIIVISFK